MTTTILSVSLLTFFALAVPIGITLGAAGIIAMISSDMPLHAAAQRMVASLDSFPLAAIPFFVLAGSVMEVAGISTRLVNLAQAMVGRLTGGLAIVTVISAMFFASISGSSAATTAAIGSILIPQMVKRGYPRSYATATQACSGELGVIIPPSIPMVIFALTAGVQVSIGDLFLAGILPGLMIGFSLIGCVYFVCRRNKFGIPTAEQLAETPSKGRAFNEALLGLLMPIIILGGIYGGIFTPTEAAVTAVVYAMFLGFVVYRSLDWPRLRVALETSVLSSIAVLFIISAANLFGWLLTSYRVPTMIAEFFVSISDQAWVYLLLVNILLLIVGCFIETGAAIIILAPILTPIAVKFGIDPTHFGLVMIVNLAVGMTTPPVGVNLFVACQIGRVRIDEIMPWMLAFWVVLIADLFVLTYVPAVSLWLPNLMKGG